MALDKMIDRDPKEALKGRFLGIKSVNQKDDFYLLLLAFVMTVIWFFYLEKYDFPTKLYMHIAGRPCIVPVRGDD